MGSFLLVQSQQLMAGTPKFRQDELEWVPEEIATARRALRQLRSRTAESFRRQMSPTVVRVGDGLLSLARDEPVREAIRGTVNNTERHFENEFGLLEDEVDQWRKESTEASEPREAAGPVGTSQ